MTSRAYLTPVDAPGGLMLAPLWLYMGTEWEAIPRGAMLDLLKDYNFEESIGGQTVEDTVNAYQNALARTFRQWTDSQPYYARVALLKSKSLIAYWPLWEPVNTASLMDIVQNINGSVSGAVFGATGIGEGHTALSYDGVSDYANVYSAALNTAFPTVRGTVAGWFKAAPGVWSDNLARYVFRFRTATNSYVSLLKQVQNNLVFSSAPGGVAITVSQTPTTLNWVPFALTFDHVAGEISAYMDGAQVGYTPGGSGVWAGALSSATNCVGAGQNNGASCWKGEIAHITLWDTVLEPEEIAYLATL